MIAGVLLAAGSRTRFGGRKLLHPLPAGAPVGRGGAAQRLRSRVSPAVAVVRPGDDELRVLLAGDRCAVVIECAAAEARHGAQPGGPAAGRRRPARTAG